MGGKKMKRGAKKELKNQEKQDKKGWKAKTSAPTPSSTNVSAKPESIIDIPQPTATTLIENSGEEPKKKKKKKKKDKEGENSEKTEKKKKKKKKKKDKEDPSTGGGKA